MPSLNLMSDKMVTPRDVWLRTHVYQEGPYLCAKTFMVAAQNPEVFEVRIDLRPIAQAVIAYHKKLHAESSVSGDCVGCDEEERAEIEGCVGCEERYIRGPVVGGFFGSIAKVIKSVGKSKLINKVASMGKTVIKSKITGAVLTGTAVVFPPVGVPALGAYVAANAALAVVDKASSLKRGVEKAIRDKHAGKLTVKAKALAQLSTTAAGKAAVAKTMKQAQTAKKFIRNVAAMARYSPNPQKQAEARKALTVLQTVAEHRRKLKDIARKTPKKGTTGLVVDARGRIMRGRFLREQAHKDAGLQIMLAAKGKVVPGYFRKVGGCIGCF